jgi:hypothetical protein
MNDDLQKNTKMVMSIVVATVLLIAGIYFIIYAPPQGKTLGGLDFNLVMGSIFIIYGLFRAYLLYKNRNESN